MVTYCIYLFDNGIHFLLSTGLGTNTIFYRIRYVVCCAYVLEILVIKFRNIDLFFIFRAIWGCTTSRSNVSWQFGILVWKFFGRNVLSNTFKCLGSLCIFAICNCMFFAFFANKNLFAWNPWSHHIRYCASYIEGISFSSTTKYKIKNGNIMKN